MIVLANVKFENWRLKEIVFNESYYKNRNCFCYK